MKKILSFLLFFVFILGVNANEKISVTFDKCVDGDTAFFFIDNKSTKVRFLGIDTPEYDTENNKIDPYGKEASDFTCESLKTAKEIVLEFDSKSDKTDKYDRTLAWIWVDNNLLEGLLLEKGYAKIRYIYDNYSNLDILHEKENYAKDNKLGLWSDYTPTYYKVTFKYDNKTKEEIVEENSLVQSFNPQKENYKFIGWYYNNKLFDFNTKINNDIILEARYQIDINILEIVILIILLITLYFIRKVTYYGRRKTKKKNRRRRSNA